MGLRARRIDYFLMLSFEIVEKVCTFDFWITYFSSFSLTYKIPYLVWKSNINSMIKYNQMLKPSQHFQYLNKFSEDLIFACSLTLFKKTNKKLGGPTYLIIKCKYSLVNKSSFFNVFSLIDSHWNNSLYVLVRCWPCLNHISETNMEAEAFSQTSGPTRTWRPLRLQ